MNTPQRLLGDKAFQSLVTRCELAEGEVAFAAEAALRRRTRFSGASCPGRR